VVTIPQHREDKSLNDIGSFLNDIDRHFRVEHWRVRDLEINGADALNIEAYFKSGKTVSNAEFRRLYAGINQTIWGHFDLLVSGEAVASLRAIDSTYWEVDSTFVEFEEYMVNKYGTYGA